MTEIKRGDKVTLWNGDTFTVKSARPVASSYGVMIVSVFTGAFYIPVEVRSITAVNGAPVADMPQQLSLFTAA